MSVYKGEKLVAGRSVNTYLARRPAWNQAVAISAADLVAGYTAPSDGIVVGTVIPPNGETTMRVLCNGIVLSLGTDDTHWASYLQPHAIVNAGDVISTNLGNSTFKLNLSFVPFEDSAVSGVEVVTPELIRNLHDPDWSQAVSITATQLVEGYTVPGRGIIVGSIIPNTYDVTGSPIIKINGIAVSYARGSSNEISHGSVQCPVCANDRVSLEGISAGSCDAHISFVPYKAQ